MNLVFLDRTAAKPAVGESFISVQPDGTCNLSSGAVLRHQLGEHRWVSVAQDTDTGIYYLVFGAGSPERKPYALRASKGKASTRSFSASAAAKELLAAFHAAPDAKSLRLVVGAPTAHEVGPLFPLSLNGQPVAPAVAPEPTPAAVEGPAAPVAEAPAAVPVLTEPPAPVVAAVVAPAKAEAPPRLSPAALPESRAEQLADYWHEREISKAEPAELAELLKVLGNTPKAERGFKENIVLGRAKAENARRGKAKGKGGNRG